MAIVNKFNVNNKQVTLDADIIENMSANNISYDASTQYDENTVGDKLSELEQKQMLGGVYDVTAHNNGVVFESLQDLLSSSNLDTLIPTSFRHGGMSIRFVQSSDDKYVQYRLMSDTFSTTENDWQGVDDTPIVGSQNLITSGGVKEESINLSKEIGSKMLELTPTWEVRYCYVTDTIGNIPTQTSNANFKCVKFPVKEGEQYIVQGKGGDVARLWAITGEDEKVISHANVSEYNTQIVNIGLDGFLYVNIYGLKTDARIWITKSGISANIHSLEWSIKLYHSIFKAVPLNLNVLPLDLLIDFGVTNRLPNRLHLIEVKVTSIKQYLTIHFTTPSAPRTIVSSQNLKNVEVFDTGVCRYSVQDADGETLSIIIDWDKIHEGDIFRYYPDEYIVKDAVYSGGILSSYLFPIKDKSIESAKLTDDAFDSTLTQERKIADAKAVGDALKEAGKLTEELQGVFPVNTYGERYWAVCGDSITSANHAKNGQFLIDGIEDIDPYCPIDGYSNLNSYKRKNYAYYFAKEHTIKWANYGYGGTTLSHCPSIGHPVSQTIPFVDDRIENLKEGVDWDFITIFFGYNDFIIGPIAEREKWLKDQYGIEIQYPENAAQIGDPGFATTEQKVACDAVTGTVGEITYNDNDAYFFAKFFGLIDDSTKETFLGAYNYALEYLIRKYTKAKIMIVAPFFSKYKELFTKGIHAMADKWGVTCFDFTDVPFWYMNPVHQQMTFLNDAEGSGGYWYTETGVGLPKTLDGYNMSRYSTDSLHPTNLGYRLLAEMFGNKMLNG